MLNCLFLSNEPFQQLNKLSFLQLMGLLAKHPLNMSILQCQIIITSLAIFNLLPNRHLKRLKPMPLQPTKRIINRTC